MDRMPPKVRELISQLETAGFKLRGGKGSHRNYLHEASKTRVTVSGKLGDDTKKYQERDVRQAIEEAKS